MTFREKFIKYLFKKLKEKKLEDKIYHDRLIKEIKEIDTAEKWEFFGEQIAKKYKYKYNELNSFVGYLIGIFPDFDINKEHKYVIGEFPDIDIDYIDAVRNELKNKWVFEYFGQDKVCHIGTYGTFGVKQSLLDISRVFDVPREEALIATKSLDTIIHSWEEALESEEFQNFCNKYPEVAEATRRIMNRNKSKGKHAGGLVISSKPLDNLVPLYMDDEGNIVSSWTEGLKDQDLQAVGLIKFDILGLTSLEQIALCCDIIKRKYNLKAICSVDGKGDWSDTSYLNDSNAISLANSGLMKSIFQFDRYGIQRLVKDGGVTSYLDLVAYSSLYRPGPLSSGMAGSYCKRKKGTEEFELHPILKPILESTYGVMVYQEQIMKILHVVGGIPLRDCEIVRKAISKKKIDKFIKYKLMFLENGKKVLGWTDEQLEEFWTNIENFAGYGFNKSHAMAYTYVSCRMLYLKANYPLEFFQAILSKESQDVKIKEYIDDAKRFGIRINPLTFNKSLANFDEYENNLYFAYSKCKGLGDDIAKEIAAKQPYKDFEDFLIKFGVSWKALKVLIGLNYFKDFGNPSKLMSFAQKFKGILSKLNALNSRFEDYLADFRKQMNDFIIDINLFDIFIKKYNDGFLDESMIKENRLKESIKLCKKYLTRYNNYNKKLHELKLPKLSEYEDDIEKEYLVYDNFEVGELEFYGFVYKTKLELIVDEEKEKEKENIDPWLEVATEFSLIDLKDYIGQSKMIVCIILNKPTEVVSKKGTKYYTVEVEDYYGIRKKINIWSDQFENYNKFFWDNSKNHGNVLAIRIDVPQESYFNLGISSTKFNKTPSVIKINIGEK